MQHIFRGCHNSVATFLAEVSAQWQKQSKQDVVPKLWHSTVFFYLTEKQKNICRLINIFSQFFKESRSHGNWIGIVSKQLQDTLLKKRGTFEKLCVEIPIRPGHHFPRICRVVASGLWFSSMFCYWSLLFTKPGVNRTAFFVGDITNQSSGNLCNIFKNLNFQVPRLYNSLDSDDRDEWESSPTGFRHGSYLVPLLPRQQSLKIRHSCYDRSRWLRFNPPQTCTCCKVRSHQVSAYLPSEWPARVQNRDVFWHSLPSDHVKCRLSGKKIATAQKV